jgi:hypothetical protein
MKMDQMKTYKISGKKIKKEKMKNKNKNKKKQKVMEKKIILNIEKT